MTRIETVENEPFVANDGGRWFRNGAHLPINQPAIRLIPRLKNLLASRVCGVRGTRFVGSVVMA